MADISKITIPVVVNGEATTAEYNLKDAAAREAIAGLGNTLYWIGVTTTELVDGTTSSATITVNDESVTASVGGMAQYNGEEFVWNGTTWQSIGKNNFGALAFKSSAATSYTPAGSVSVEATGGSTATVNSITAVGTLPSLTVSSETLIFDPGTLPTKGADQTVVSSVGTLSGSFSGTQASITVS